MTEQEEQPIVVTDKQPVAPASISKSVAAADKEKKAFGAITQAVMAGIVIIVLFVLGAVGAYAQSFLLLSVVVGSVGGLIHDLIENKAIVLYPSSSTEGIYIGWMLGIILGGAAGFIAYASGVIPTNFDAKLLLAPFTAGIALKGVIDSATNTSASEVKTKPNS